MVETLIVLVLIAIAAAYLIPSMDFPTVDRLRCAADVVRYDMSFAQDLAISRGDLYRLTFDNANACYTLAYAGAATPTPTLPATPFAPSNESNLSRTTKLRKIPGVGADISIYSVLETNGASSVSVDRVTFTSSGGTQAIQETIVWLVAGQGANRRYVPVRVNAVSGLAVTGDPQANAP